MLFSVTFDNTNTTVAPSLNVDTTGDIDIKINGIAPAIGDLKPNTTYLLSYDGSEFQVINVIPNFAGATVTAGPGTFDIEDNGYTVGSITDTVYNFLKISALS